MQSLFSQVQSNPELQANALQSPFMQQMMNQMMSNPTLMTAVRTLSQPFCCGGDINFLKKVFFALGSTQQPDVCSESTAGRAGEVFYL